MSTISIIGSGNMARAIGARAVKGGNQVEVASRDPAKAEDLARTLGGGATAGKFGAAPIGDIVILAVPYATAVPVVEQYGDALAAKVIVDITNPFNADGTGLVTADGTSIAQEIAKVAPASAHVVKAFNTIFGHVLAQEGRNMDVIFAGDDAQAKARVSVFVESLGLRHWMRAAWGWRAGWREPACWWWASHAMAWRTLTSPSASTFPSVEYIDTVICRTLLSWRRSPHNREHEMDDSVALDANGRVAEQDVF